MSLQDELTATRRRLDELDRCLASLESHVGPSLDMRRVRSDAAHLREDLALLGESAPAGRSGTAGRAADPAVDTMITVPDAPYDRSLWVDAEEEGLGARDRRAP
ncbi:MULTISPECIES: hypothetical protein [Streptomycetaceae]|uniref:Uncharacterized protein n=1 Tax=Streptantibioticus cattleyicolor (strain ATCC 35852 / DSM 46488 / JCM 4925 / NBRC 14057 / NRRL 8057) TaxID=1003195 RepID=F8K3J8_STREN|nr:MULTISPECIES: hypothetical protein [Streptomycetaceae]AEW96316.1 hypothetical protein SCATT_39450 [Streptantibioticus cattleyicolor NRRL 8057 = DSM 46488]MYS60832.1 hypothetical protein [Streptomyces sp. SID5468]CCB76656.1 conserved protein of unknown function [Streptantibioticus cattleyicolor NRRL 8057 = DSM 46488]